MASPFDPDHRYTVEEYLRLERTAHEKHEYRNGRVFPAGNPPVEPRRPGGEVRENRIEQNLSSLLGPPDELRRRGLLIRLGSFMSRSDSFAFDRFRADSASKAFLLISPDDVRVELYERSPNGSWSFAIGQRLSDVMRAKVASFELSLAAVYDGVDVWADPDADLD